MPAHAAFTHQETVHVRCQPRDPAEADSRPISRMLTVALIYPMQVYELLYHNYVEDDDNMFRCGCWGRSTCSRAHAAGHMQQGMQALAGVKPMLEIITTTAQPRGR